MRSMSTSAFPRGDSGPRHVRLQVDLVLEVTDGDRLTEAALVRTGDDEPGPEDEADAVACLVDPVGLVADLPGVELVRAAWSSAHTEFDPDADDEWDLYENENENDDGDEKHDDGDENDEGDEENDDDGAARE
jgi:hypothetical protein